jgi:ssRNA-specific RNase YbeY (16S rRNA maturation enzyme)
VLGYDHPEDETRTKSEMWELQEQILKTLPPA